LSRYDTDQLDELPLRQAREHRHPLRPIRTQHTIHTVIVNNHDHRSTRHAVTGQPLASRFHGGGVVMSVNSPIGNSTAHRRIGRLAA
jgi:hypothetical protein